MVFTHCSFSKDFSDSSLLSNSSASSLQSQRRRTKASGPKLRTSSPSSYESNFNFFFQLRVQIIKLFRTSLRLLSRLLNILKTSFLLPNFTPLTLSTPSLSQLISSTSKIILLNFLQLLFLPSPLLLFFSLPSFLLPFSFS